MKKIFLLTLALIALIVPLVIAQPTGSALATGFYNELYADVIMNPYQGVGTVFVDDNLDVDGDVTASGFCIGADCITSWPSNGGDVGEGEGSNWQVSGSNIYRDSGRVGIGTSSPSDTLHVVGRLRAQGDDAVFRLIGTDHVYQEFFSQGPGSRSGFIGYGSSGTPTMTIMNQMTGGQLRLGTEYATRLTIGSDGNVGIGTTNPSRNLDVVATSGTDLRVRSDSNVMGTLTSMEVSSGNTISLFNVRAGVDVRLGSESSTPLHLITNDLSRLTITSAGDVGIGTSSPGAKLDVDGKIVMRDETSSEDADNVVATKGYVDSVAGSSGGSGGSNWQVSGSNIYRPTGNVGIGTSSPGSKLDVAGDLTLKEKIFYESINHITVGRIDADPSLNVEEEVFVHSYSEDVYCEWTGSNCQISSTPSAPEPTCGNSYDLSLAIGYEEEDIPTSSSPCDFRDTQTECEQRAPGVVVYRFTYTYCLGWNLFD